MFSDQKGQSLLELLVVITVSLLVISAITFATITALRSASLAKNQAQATKLAQEGLEKVRAVRDRNGQTTFVRSDLTTTTKFSDLWAINFNCPTNCYFWFTNSILTGGGPTTYETITSGFDRQIQITDGADPAAEKQVTIIVKWSDFSGVHESKLTTLLRKI